MMSSKQASKQHTSILHTTSPPRHQRRRAQHARKSSKNTNNHETRVFVKLCSDRRARTCEIDSRTSERVNDDAGDEPGHRVSEEDERRGKHDASTREHRVPFSCRLTDPTGYLCFVAEDRDERGDHAQHRARDSDQTANSRDAIPPRKRHESHRGAEDNSRHEACTGSDDKQRGSAFRNMVPLNVEMSVIPCSINEREMDAKT